VNFTDVSPVFGPESSNGSAWRSTYRVLLFNDSATPITGVTYTVRQQNLGNNTLDFGNFAINGVAQNPNSSPFTGATVGGWTCTVNYPSLQTANWVCSGDLAADPGTPGNNVSGGGASQVILDFLIGNEVFGPAAVVNGVSEWSPAATPNTVVCTNPTPCTNLVASPANSDGSQLFFNDTDTITVSADVDLGAVNDVPGGQDLTAASATTTSGIAYTIFNDSTTPITGVNFSGSISGTAPRNTAVATVSNASWTCTTTQSTWTCSGDLAAETQASNQNNATDAGAPNSQVTITILVPVGPGDAAGQTVVYTPNAVSCTGSPTPCTSGSVSTANTDGSNLVFPPNTDTLI
jgi:hypothetical protein